MLNGLSFFIHCLGSSLHVVRIMNQRTVKAKSLHLQCFGLNGKINKILFGGMWK